MIYDEENLTGMLLAIMSLSLNKKNEAPIIIPNKFLKLIESFGYGKLSKDGNTFRFSPDGLEMAEQFYMEYFDPETADMARSVAEEMFETLENELMGGFNETELPEFIPEENTTKVFTLKITLKYVKPNVWRRIKIPGSLSLEDLKEIIFLLFNWSGMHLFAFYVGQYEYPEPDDDIMFGFSEPYETKDELSQYQLSGLLRDEKKFNFIYDFGDYWDHEIIIEKVEEDPLFRIPQVLKIKGASPIEDIGGPPGFAMAKEILESPSHPEYEEFSESLPDGVTAPEPQLDEVNDFLNKMYQSGRLRIVE